MDATDYRIESVELVMLNNVRVVMFKAFRKDGNRFVFHGAFSAPAKTSTKNLWKIADAVT